MEAAAPSCRQCGTEYAPDRRACPRCGALIHAARLKVLAGEAAAATSAGDEAIAAARWDEALALLPPGSRQHELIPQRLAQLRPPSLQPAVADPAPDSFAGRFIRGAGILGAPLLLLW